MRYTPSRLARLFLTRMLVLLAVGFWLAVMPAQAAADERLATRLDAVLDRLSETGAVLHARVIELPSGRELYARRIDEACTPASNFKLLTTAVGLDLFGADHTFKTYLAIEGDDLWLIGTGDPATGDPRLAHARDHTPVTMLDEWADQLISRGIRRIRGDLVYYDAALEDLQLHPSWPEHWLLQWYAAPAAGLNFNNNCVDITVVPGAVGEPVRYEVMPPVRGITIKNECRTVDENGSPSIVKLPGGNIYKLAGTSSESKELISKPVEDPGAFFADALRTHLAARGIEIDGQIRRSPKPLGGAIPPPPDKIVATCETTLADVLARVNKNSQNLFAECLVKLAGQEYERRHGRQLPGSWESGGKAIRAFLRANGIDDASLAPMDGSGLSRDNRVTARMLTDLLAVMHRRPDAENYRASLTVCGVDGSLRDRMKDIEGRVHGKTGYIGGVSSLAGYLQTRTDEWLAFAIIYNSIPQKVQSRADTVEFMKLQDEACLVLHEWPHDSLTCPAPPKTREN